MSSVAPSAETASGWSVIEASACALYDTFNEIYRYYFSHGFHARALLGANSLLRGAHYEVLGIAVRRRVKGPSRSAN